MKAIVISEKDWLRLKNALLDRLDLQRFKMKKTINAKQLVDGIIADVKRRFRYEVCMFFDEVEKS